MRKILIKNKVTCVTISERSRGQAYLIHMSMKLQWIGQSYKSHVELSRDGLIFRVHSHPKHPNSVKLVPIVIVDALDLLFKRVLVLKPNLNVRIVPVRSVLGYDSFEQPPDLAAVPGLAAFGAPVEVVLHQIEIAKARGCGQHVPDGQDGTQAPGTAFRIDFSVGLNQDLHQERLMATRNGKVF